jgi:hypothetical protein
VGGHLSDLKIWQFAGIEEGKKFLKIKKCKKAWKNVSHNKL